MLSTCNTLTKLISCDSKYTLSSVTGSGHVKYMASPIFDFYMTTCHVLQQLTCHVQVTLARIIAVSHESVHVIWQLLVVLAVHLPGFQQFFMRVYISSGSFLWSVQFTCQDFNSCHNLPQVSRHAISSSFRLPTYIRRFPFRWDVLEHCVQSSHTGKYNMFIEGFVYLKC